MTNKQIKKYAQKIWALEQKHEDVNATPEEKAKAEAELFQITQEIMSMPRGFETMCDIDEYIMTYLI